MSGFRVRLERLEGAVNSVSNRERLDAAEAEACGRVAAEPHSDLTVLSDELTAKYGGGVGLVAVIRATVRKWKQPPHRLSVGSEAFD
jgi:hypothetical protein